MQDSNPGSLNWPQPLRLAIHNIMRESVGSCLLTTACSTESYSLAESGFLVLL